MKDTDLMPFGVHKGKQMQEVPAHYLLWLYDNNKCNGEVKEYIKSNHNVLLTEIKRSKK